MAHRWAVASLISLSAFVSSCGDRSEANNQETRTVRAATMVVQSNTVAGEFQAPGTIRARTATVLSSKALGQILSVAVREGDRVRQGQAVVEIDGREAAAQLRRAQAAVAEAQRGLEEADRAIEAAEAGLHSAEANRDLASATLKRYEVLKERRSVSAQEFDEVETKHEAAMLEAERSRHSLAAARARRLQISARIEQAEAEVETAQIAQGYFRIASPIDGVVTTRHAEPGTLATPGLPLLAIEDDTSYELEAALEESRAVEMAVGQKARVEIDAIPGEPIEGRVREIVPFADPATRTYAVRLQIPELHIRRNIRSGLFGRVFFQSGERQALLIPESALVRRGQLEGVYVVHNGAAMLRLIKTGKRYGRNVEVLSGLTPGDRIVTAPGPGIGDGVKIIDDTSARTMP